MASSSMEDRKEDARIYIISFLFFACIIGGGVFLSLYILFPQPKSWYPTAGLILVAIPWVFWFFAYIYSCLKPHEPEFNDSHRQTPATPASVATANSSRAESPVNSPGGGERHVRFGGVVVLGKEETSAGQREHEKEGHSPMKSERPLTLLVSS
ncbi:putative uncharacterized [Fagus crenata]